MFDGPSHLRSVLVLPRAAKRPLRAALALGFAAWALAGCGGSDSESAPVPPPAPPAPTLAAPANFTLQDFADFRWSATPSATRYELHADPDGAGPQPEAKVEDFNPGTGTGFQYSQITPQGFAGWFYGRGTADATAALFNSSYRLRACDAQGCGAFTESVAPDVAAAISREFASGRAPLKSSAGLDGSPKISRDGLTVAFRAANGAVYVLTRASSTQPWQVQAQVISGKSDFAQRIALSADGGTLAVQINEPSAGNPDILQGVVYVHQRSANAWTQQAVLNAPSPPPACAQACRASLGDFLALSVDGRLLAASVNYSTSAGTDAFVGSAVATYTRDGATWTQQQLLQTSGQVVSSLAVSGDGSTLAVNEGSLDTLRGPLTSTTPYVRVFSQQGGNWAQQARIPAGIVSTTDVSGSLYSAMALSGDGNTLAVHAVNVPGHPTPELDVRPADLSCGAMAENNWYIALYARNGATWQRQAAISRGLAGKWAIAPDGNGLFYGNALFTRSGSVWTCP